MVGRDNRLPRVAVLGGTRGISVAGNWHKRGLSRMVAVCDLEPAVAHDRLEQLGMAASEKPRVYQHSDDMFKWGEFDAVVIATPDATHYKLAAEAFESGFNCFIEKPMTSKLEDAVELVKCWRRSGRIGVVGHEFRHATMITEAKKKIEEGVIGTPRLAFTVDSCGRMGSYWRRKEWRSDIRPSENSLTLQKAIHQLDIQSFLLGSRPRRVYASAGADHYGGDKPGDLKCDECTDAPTCPYNADKMKINYSSVIKPAKDRLCVYTRNVDIHDNQIAVIDYSCGARGSYIECFFTPDYKVEHTVIGDLGRMTLQYFFGNPYNEIEISWIGKHSSERHVYPAKGGHGGGDHVLGHVFTNAVREGVQPQPDLIEGYWAIALAVSIDRSSASGQPVELPGKLSQS